MLAWELSEGIVNNVRDLLSNSLPTKLSELRVTLGLSPGDHVDLPNPVSYERTEPTLPAAPIPSQAVVYVYSDRGALSNWREESVMPAHSLIVACLMTHSDLEKLTLGLYRYAKAIFEVLVDGHFDDTLNWIMIGDIEFDYSGALFQDEVGLSDVVIRAVFTEVETRP